MLSPGYRQVDIRSTHGMWKTCLWSGRVGWLALCIRRQWFLTFWIQQFGTLWSSQVSIITGFMGTCNSNLRYTVVPLIWKKKRNDYTKCYSEQCIGRKTQKVEQNCKLQFVYPSSTKEFIRTRWNVSVRSRSNWNLKVLVFKERGKPEYPEKNLSEQGREPTTNSTHIFVSFWNRVRV